jgi:4-hydroxybenzoate polyprenyltransferase
MTAESTASTTSGVPSFPRARRLAYAQLVRLPNVFTAIADILMAALAVGALTSDWLAVLLAILASSSLYCAGMVWNDFFDIEQDRRERPFRPLPSGRVSRASAQLVGVALLSVGLGCAVLVDVQAGRFPGLTSGLAVLLVAAILLYDAWLKRTPFGPVAMGLCRFLNVLMGLSVAAGGIPSWSLVLPAVVGLYIVGVTWFARTEARDSERAQLRFAAGVIAGALVLALAVPALGRPLGRSEDDWQRFLWVDLGQIAFPYLLVAFGLYLAIPLYAAIERPVPARVQAAVKRSVLGLVLLDALLATALVGSAGLLIAVLLAPARLLGRWLYST